MFTPGMKAICVHAFDCPDRHYLHSAMPQKGQVYTVRSTYKSSGEPFQGLRFEEIVSRIVIDPWDFVKHEAGFCCIHFRPLVESKGMETLWAILTVKQKEDA